LSRQHCWLTAYRRATSTSTATATGITHLHNIAVAS
jgi:hypothetical protein